jgi:Carboxypeptidase regulatory-like domain
MGTISRMTTKRKTKKKKFDMHFDFLRHPLLPFGHLTHVRWTIALIGWAWLAGALVAVEPAGSAQNSSGSHAHDFVIFTTVFDSRGFALFGARVRVRRSEEKKFRWEGTSDHSGELAFRVPPAVDYEMTIEARGFKTQTRRIDSRKENRAELTVRMEPQSEPHAEPGPGGKP